MRTAGLYISGLGTFLPDTVSVSDAIEQGRCPAYKSELGWTGIAVAGEIPAPEMGLQAAQEALKRAEFDPLSVDLLLYADTWHQGPDGWHPQFYLQRHLLGGDLLAVELRHGCSGVFSAFELAAGYLTDPSKQAALVVAADNFGTPLLDRWTADAGFIAGDAATAAVLGKNEGFAELLAVGSTSVPLYEEMHRAGEPLFPPGPTTGSELNFERRQIAFRQKQIAEGSGRESAAAMQRKALVCLQQVLSDAQVGLDEITRVIIPNSSADESRELFLNPLNFPIEKSTWEYGRTIGHLGASDQLMSLDHLLATHQVGPGDHILLLGLAPGITFSCAVLKILEIPSWAPQPSLAKGAVK